ncbi:rab11 family-interacting protein 4-like [Bolinopsis microptera]|uniref:rab11 family-interacting protein 4-like n=1 Tax=Bolinopsis microptera TaxID=2820187 RepID=UPI003078EAFF
MVTRDAVLTIFEECDRDNDGIVWLSEIKQLALSYSSSNEDELETDQDEDVPLTFEDFLEKFAPQLKGLTPEQHICNGELEEESKDGQLENFPNENGGHVTLIETDSGNKNLMENVKILGTSSGVSDCSIEPPPSLGAGPPNEAANFAFSPEEGFEGYGEVSSDEELLIEDKVDLLNISAVVECDLPSLSPTGSFRRKNSPFRLSQRRLKRSSAPVIVSNPDPTVEEDLRQDIEDLSKKVVRLETDLGDKKNLIEKLRNEKLEIHEKVLHLEEIYRDLDISAKKSERTKNDAIQELSEKFDGLRDSIESERHSFSLQLRKYEDEIKHSHEVKDKLTEEVVRLREVWADSQEQEAMWETKYNEMLAISSHQDHEIEQLQTANEKGRLSHTNVAKELQDEIHALNQEIEELSTRKRSDTIIGRLQGKVDRIQEENAHLKEMTEEMLSSDHNPARATPLALEIDSASQEEIVSAYTAVQKDYGELRSYVDKLLMNIIAEAPHLLCVDNSS